MKVAIEVELQPFQVPNFVTLVGRPGLKQDGMKPRQSLPLSDLDSITLDRLCREFRNEVFRKADKSQPPTQAPETKP